MKTAVIAVGGNAILVAGEKGTKEEQLRNLKLTCSHIAELIKEGYDLVLTHGNGPQVGNIFLQQELGENAVPGMPLDVCGAESQGEIGYLFQQVLTNEVLRLGLNKCVVSVITQVLVDKDDPAFSNPTKPIGRYYRDEESFRLMWEKGWQMGYDKGRGGWRRLVPSPMPKDIVEREAIRRLVFSGSESPIVVIAGGGGGIPVIKTANGYEGVEAVIDKDLSASVLASSINEERFIMLTAVPKVYLNFGTPQEVGVDKMSVEEARRWLSEGQFPAGSMGPKIEAGILFLERGGREVIITSPENLLKAIRGEEGTHIIK